MRNLISQSVQKLNELISIHRLVVDLRTVYLALEIDGCDYCDCFKANLRAIQFNSASRLSRPNVILLQLAGEYCLVDEKQISVESCQS